jgi:hypothetical protein
VSRFGDLIYPLLAPSMGGLLRDHYFDFPVGGIDDNAAWTSFMWNRLAGWLVYGPPSDPPPISSGTDTHSQSIRKKALDAKKRWITTAREILHQASPLSKSLFMAYDGAKASSKPSTGTYVGLNRNRPSPSQEMGDTLMLESLANSLIDCYLLSVFPDLLESNSAEVVLAVRKNIAERAQEIAKQIHNPKVRDETPTPPVSVSRVVASGSNSHDYFGSSLSISLRTGDMLVGAPGTGRAGGPQEGSAQLMVGATSANHKSSYSAAKYTVTFPGGRGGGLTTSFPSYERFGWSSASVDANGDGVDDWVICAPSYGGGRDTEAAKGNYTGRCDVFYGPFKPNSADALGPIPDASIFGDREWGNFGYSIESADVDGDGSNDLIISAPFAGRYFFSNL